MIGKTFKKESIGSWEIEFVQPSAGGLIFAIGYFGGKPHNRHDIGEGMTKSEALKKARVYIRNYEKEFKAMPEPYYQYRRNFWSG
jgi:hypothetical protein